jgi:REP-associated tyrosine transposase
MSSQVPEGRHKMAHSYSSVLIHLIFSTKRREPNIPAERQEALWSYLIGIGNNHNLTVIAAGGIETHVHLLFVLPQTIALAKAVQTFKANSSRWLSEHGLRFAWQEGYAAFSVSRSQAAHVQRYIANQLAHHRRQSFEEEFELLLKKSAIKYDPKYMFG